MRRCLLLVLWLAGCADQEPVVIVDPDPMGDMGGMNNNTMSCSQDAQCGANAYCDAGLCAPKKVIDPNAPNAPCRHKADCAIVDVPEQTFAQATESLDINCTPTPGPMTEFGPSYEFSFSLSAGAQSFLAVPFVSAGELRALHVETPTGTLDINAEYKHHNVRLETNGYGGLLDGGTFNKVSMDWPVMVPYAPKYAEHITPGGAYKLRVASSATPCMYVLEQTIAMPSRLDVNFYFVGLEGLSAPIAPTHPEFQDVLDRFEGIFSKAGVTLGQVRYFDIKGEDEQQFQILRDPRDVYELTARGVSPGASLGDNMSVDVFLVRSITLQGGAVLGLSGGIPGAAGMHGNSANGLVFSALDLGRHNGLLAHIMAHEMGHFLGLRHTTEILRGLGNMTEDDFERRFGLTDPIDDSPSCMSPLSQTTSCPDYTNLMFVAAPPAGATFEPIITEGQKAVLHKNPLLRSP